MQGDLSSAISGFQFTDGIDRQRGEVGSGHDGGEWIADGASKPLEAMRFSST